MSKTGISAILLIGLLAGSGVGAAALDEADALQLVTEEVEPGVERIISDGFGHDLDETHPSYRYDMDAVAVAADGTVWLRTTHSGSDNAASGRGPLVWALGQSGTYTHEHGLPDVDDWIVLHMLADGTPLVFTGDGVRRFDGERFVPDDGPMVRQMADGRLLLFVDGAAVTSQLPEGQVADIPDLYLVWGPQSDGWGSLGEPRRQEARTGDYRCWIEDGVSCRRLGRKWRNAAPTTFLGGTGIGQVAAAPDGPVWAVGEYGGGNGGLYRITLPPIE